MNGCFDKRRTGDDRSYMMGILVVRGALLDETISTSIPLSRKMRSITAHLYCNLDKLCSTFAISDDKTRELGREVRQLTLEDFII